MLKKLLIAFGVLLVIFLAGLLTTFLYVDGQFGIRQAPALTYMEYGGAHADIAMRLDPNQARQLILELVGQQFPDAQGQGWIQSLLETSLPHEIVLMADPRYTDQIIDLTLYVNERRGGPVLARELSNMLLGQVGADPVAWNPEGARLERRGAIVLTGTTRLHNQTIQDIDRRWGGRSAASPQVMEGGHLFEVIAANRKGSLYALVAALAIADPDKANPAVLFAMEEVKQLDMLHATANFVSDDEMAITLDLMCDRSIEEGRPESMRLMLDQIVLPQLAKAVHESYGLTLTGGFRRDGYDLEGVFTLSGLKPVIAQAMTAK